MGKDSQDLDEHLRAAESVCLLRSRGLRCTALGGSEWDPLATLS
jgi:hypothetical protein